MKKEIKITIPRIPQFIEKGAWRKEAESLNGSVWRGVPGQIDVDTGEQMKNISKYFEVMDGK